MQSTKMTLQRLALAGAAIFPATVSGHTLDQAAYSLANGMLHPILGWDHITVMLAVGVWAALLSNKAWWKVPIAFAALMPAGIGLAMITQAIPLTEAGIALTLLALGLLLFKDIRLPAATGAVIVGFFALVHGYAHGTEQTVATLPLSYFFGLVLVTLILHAVGFGFGKILQNTWTPALRTGGAILAGSGVGMLLVVI